MRVVGLRRVRFATSCRSLVRVAMPLRGPVGRPDPARPGPARQRSLEPRDDPARPVDLALAVMFAVPIPYLVPIVQAGQIVLVPADRMG